MAERKELIGWLNDAYSMELSLEEVLQRHLKDAESISHVRSRLQQHLDETRAHADRVKQCIESLGGSVSRTKAMMADVMGRVQGMASGAFDDELVKNMLRDYTSEHLEIASYTSLIAAAEELGEASVAEICRDILDDEREMAEWIEQQIPLITKGYLRSKLRAAA